jgi:four helix bundle protein
MEERKKARKFQDLIVWQKAHDLVMQIYKLSKDYPLDERFGLISQIRRSAVSIPANIAEGFKKWYKNDKIKFLNIAQCSLEETRYYLILSKDLGYKSDDSLFLLIEEVSKLLNSYSSSILGSEC